VHAEPSECLIELDVSDFAPGELTAEVVGSSVVVRGERRDDEDSHAPFSVRERLEEIIRLPDDVDPGGVTATYRQGTLELRARRRKPPRRRVPIERASLVGSTPAGC
jgi:HSP20 family molecular chaperone IbpA